MILEHYVKYTKKEKKMNNINDEVLQMKTEKHCLEYPSHLDLSVLIHYTKYICDRAADYGQNLLNQDNDNYTLLLAIKCTLNMVIEYFEKIEQEKQKEDIKYEGYLSIVCLHFQCEMYRYAKTIKDDPTIFESFELLGLLFRILGTPIKNPEMVKTPTA